MKEARWLFRLEIFSQRKASMPYACLSVPAGGVAGFAEAVTPTMAGRKPQGAVSCKRDLHEGLACCPGCPAEGQQGQAAGGARKAVPGG